MWAGITDFAAIDGACQVIGAGEGASLEESFLLAFHPDHSNPICKVYGK